MPHAPHLEVAITLSLWTKQEFKEILHKEETDTVEFKSWVNARNMKEIISLAVDELIAFANSKGGTDSHF